MYASEKTVTGTVYSLEPVPDNFKLLNRNLKLNRITNVLPLQFAVAKESGPVELFTTQQSGSHSLDEDYHHSKNILTKKIITVNCITLDELMLTQNISRCDFLKIDCEGAEYEILYSLPVHLYSKIEKISLEYHLKLVQEREEKTKQLEEFLGKHNYELVHKRTAGKLAGLMYFRKRNSL